MNNLTNGYTVPLGKRLYLFTWNSGNPRVNNLEMTFYYYDTKPMILNSSDNLLSTASPSKFHGYLVDENYFAGCGGGGSSSASSTIPNVTNYGDMLVWYNNGWVSLPVGSDGSILTIQNGLPLWVDNSLIGSSLDGGVIGYILQPGDSGFVYGEQHGIIININANLCGQWGCNNTFTGVTSSVFGSGPQNTNLIASQNCASSGSAATTCLNLSLNGYNDWFIASEDEMHKIINAFPDLVNHFSGPQGSCSNAAWLSTEHNSMRAKIVGSSYQIVNENKADYRTIFPCRYF